MPTDRSINPIFVQFATPVEPTARRLGLSSGSGPTVRPRYIPSTTMPSTRSAPGRFNVLSQSVSNPGLLLHPESWPRCHLPHHRRHDSVAPAGRANGAINLDKIGQRSNSCRKSVFVEPQGFGITNGTGVELWFFNPNFVSISSQMYSAAEGSR
ncbi:hypothetical protein VTN31DRAFT_5806 [Thermomyces dupontii]|uniref:uncharacterized protein n=1 Tax=Talaromyces thermophilus TaxID=28565 RepID=UPI003744238E